MAVSEGLFKSQDQAQQDLVSGPGWTIDEQKPQFWDSFGALPAVTGIGSGLANGIATLAGGMKFHPQSEDPFDKFTASGQAEELQPWQKKSNDILSDIETQARTGAKMLMPDPRTTGTAANLVNGFARSVTEFGVGALAGGPEAGAATVGTAEGYARFHDLKDQGVDDDTAMRSALIAGVANGAGAIAPFSLPAKLLAPLSSAGTLLTQAGAGATINASMGAAAREGDALILKHAGYPEMAEQMKPWDEANLLTDALTGAFFGAHAGFHGLKDSPIGPAVRDAAKVVQNRQEVINRAPGVPVDMPSAAIHREALETALGDLLNNKPVDLSAERLDGGTFARPEQDTQLQRDIIREEFEKSGVLEDADDFDKWLTGDLPKPAEAPRETAEGQIGEMLTPEGVQARLTDAQERLQEAGPEPKPEERAAAIEADRAGFEAVPALKERYGEELPQRAQELAERPFKAADEARTTAQKDLEGAQADQEKLARTADPAAAALADRPDMQIPAPEGFRRVSMEELAAHTAQVEKPFAQRLREASEAETPRAQDVLQFAKDQEVQVNKEADTAFTTAVNCEARHAG